MDTDQQLTPYIYQPLERPESIRIFALHPATEQSAPLAGVLLHDDRENILNDCDDIRQYETVSYAWGKPIFTHWIVLDGTARLSITANVDSMLRHLRKGHRKVRLWVDAICLNQEDAAEKGVQVRLMGEIYQCARKLHLWLGSGGEQDVAAVFRHLHHGMLAAKLAEGNSSSLHTHVPWSSVQKLLHLPWFRRRWVVQEVELSSDITVHWMNRKIAWNVFLSGLQQLNARGEELDVLSQSVLAAVCGLGGVPSSMLELLWRHHQAHCSDHRDRLYSLFSLAKDITDPNSEPTSALPSRTPGALSQGNHVQQLIDYTCQWPNIYVRFAKMCLRRGYFQELLIHCCDFKSLSRHDINHPSWVPDWSIPRHEGTLAAANYGRRELDIPTLSTSILLQGKISLNCREHQVENIFGGWSPSTGSDLIQNEMDAITRACRRGGIRPANLLRIGISHGIFKDDFDAMKRSLANSWLDPEAEGFDDDDSHAFVYAMSQYQFYVCVDGSIGVGPITLKEQDMIVRSQEGSNHLDPVFQVVGREATSFGGYIYRIVGYVWHHELVPRHRATTSKRLRSYILV